MKPKFRRRSRTAQQSPLVLLCVACVIGSQNASAVNYQWNGSTSNWQTATNWSTVTAPPLNTAGSIPVFNNAPTGQAHRLNVNGATPLVYTASEGSTLYANTVAASRGLVIGSGTAGGGTLTITGGTFSTLGSTAGDVIGNGSGNTGTLHINGGTFIGTNAGTGLGIGGGPVSNLNISAGTATLATLNFNNFTGNLNLDGGLLELNNISYSGGIARMNFNGGTLRARQSNANFIPLFTLPGNPPITADAFVKAGGFIMDTNGFNVTIGEPLIEDPSSTGGDITKNGAGTLTLSAPSTVTADVTINGGGLGVRAGITSWQPATFTHSGTALNFDLGVYNPLNPPVINVADLTLNTANITVNISGSSIPVSSEIKILDYGTKTGSGSLTLNVSSLPSNMVATLEENTVDGYYYLVVTSPSATSFTWSGDTNADGTGLWNTTSQNWNANSSLYAQPALVTFPNIAAGGTVTIEADFAPLAFTINNTSPNHYTFNGAGKITGSAGITKSGTGIASFNGAAHTYGGNLSINAGAVIKQAADATTGNITVAADDVSFVLSGGITDGAGQTLTMSGRGSLTGGYFFSGSSVQRGALQAHNGANTWEGDIVLASNSTATFNRIGVQNGASLTLTGTISENVPGAILLFRAGNSGDNITLGGTSAYTYTGQTQIFSNGGSIILGSDNKLPTTSSVFFGSSGTTVFDMNGMDQEFAGLTSNATQTTATITNLGSGPSILTTNSPSESPAEAADYFPALITNGANSISFVKNGAGTQIFAANNSYTGTTTINAGRLEIQENQSGTGDVIINGGNLKLSFVRTLASGVNMSIASGAFFYLDGSSQTLGKLEGAGTIDFTYNVAGVDNLTVGANDASSTFDGVIQQSQPRTYALRKIGTGTFTLTGLNTYTGNTTVEAGTLSVAQSNFADTSTVTIGLTESSPAVLNLPNAGTDIVAELIIDGISQPGNGLVYDENNSGGAITGPGKLQVGIGGYAAWANSNNILLGENGDDDKDGIINLVEYALGLNPQASSVPAGTLVGNLLTFVKGPEAKIALDVTYQIETSTTLLENSWTAPLAAETTDDISFQLPPNQLGGKIFARLKVTKP
jgi:fibronectin-binding autotransporter adhesin